MTPAGRHDRDAPGPAPPRVSTAHSDPFQVLCAEHAILRRDFARWLDSPGAKPARGDLVSLARSLEVHLRREERVVVPVVERLFGGKEGAASVLREEHASIRLRLESLAEESPAGRGLSRVRADMLRLQLDDHFRREERVLFPLAAAFLSGTESGAMARRLRVDPVR